MSAPLHIIHVIYTHGVMPGPHHYFRSRLIQGEPRSAYLPCEGGGWGFASSSLHARINMRAGLHEDHRRCEPRCRDLRGFTRRRFGPN